MISNRRKHLKLQFLLYLVILLEKMIQELDEQKQVMVHIFIIYQKMSKNYLMSQYLNHQKKRTKLKRHIKNEIYINYLAVI